MQRRLEAEKTPREVIDGVRHRMALSYLEDPVRSIDDVALLVGCSDARVFARAFRRCTGMTPQSHCKARSEDRE